MSENVPLFEHMHSKFAKSAKYPKKLLSYTNFLWGFEKRRKKFEIRETLNYLLTLFLSGTLALILVHHKILKFTTEKFLPPATTENI
jgi:hypothetical protein